MKKVLLTIMMAIACVTSVFAETTQERIQRYEKYLAETKHEWNKCEWTTYINVLKANTQTVDEIVKIAKDTSSKFKVGPMAYKYFVGRVMRNEFERKLLKEGWAYVKVNELSTEVFVYVLFHSNQLNISSKEKVDLIVKHIGQVNAGRAKLGVQLVINEIGEWEDEAAAKAALKKMNRKLSKNLLNDKATWEPIVAMIRTTLETY